MFSKSGHQKERYIIYICGISIAQDDTHPDGICRKCERFVNKMWLFRQTCQQVQINLRQMKSIKKLSSSPMEKPGNKCQNLNLVTSVYHNDYNSHVTACIYIYLQMKSKHLKKHYTQQPLVIASTASFHVNNCHWVTFS